MRKRERERETRRGNEEEVFGDQKEGLLEKHSHIAAFDSHLVCLTQLRVQSKITGGWDVILSASKSSTNAAKTSLADLISGRFTLGSNYKPAVWSYILFMGFDRSP